MPMRTRSRMRRTARRRPMSRSNKKRSYSKTKRRVSFKTKALAGLNSKPLNNVFYETTIAGGPVEIAAPELNVGRCISILNSGANYDGRFSSTIHLSGIRFRGFFQNRQLRPTTVHVAFVRPKQGQTVTAPVTFQERFFQRMGEGSAGSALQGLGFNEVPNGIQYATLPINTDEYHVLWHTRFKLGVTSTTGGYSSGELKNYRTLYRYIKIGRTITFPDRDSAFPDVDSQIYVCVWSCPLDYDRVAETEPNPNSLKLSTHIVCVFRRQSGAT